MKLPTGSLSVRRAAAAALLGGVIVVALASHSGSAPTSDSAAKSATFTKQMGVPVRLTIPRLGVDASVDQMGVTPAGAMEAPVGAHTVGWFRFGPHPGERGSAVIAGHYGRWKSGGGSVFDLLHTLREGDRMAIRDEAGAVTTFVVRESRSYDPAADTSGVFGSTDGKSHLNLVTCEGVWDDGAKSYSKRLVVFTDKA